MKADTLTLYRIGSIYSVEEIFNEGDCTELPEKVKSDYEAKYPESEFMIITVEDAVSRIRATYEAKDECQWKEVDENRYFNMLGAVPPIKWEAMEGIEIFQMGECQFMNYYSFLIKAGERYFEAIKRTTKPYEEVRKEIIEFMK